MQPAGSRQEGAHLMTTPLTRDQVHTLSAPLRKQLLEGTSRWARGGLVQVQDTPLSPAPRATLAHTADTTPTSQPQATPKAPTHT